jgi:CRP-like cAMP-binding protein
MSDPNPQFANKLLRRLDSRTIALLGELERVDLVLRQPIETAGEPIERIYFPDTGLISVVEHVAGVGSIEVGMIGNEGVSGVSVLLEDERASFDVFVQGPGEAWCIEAGRLRAAMEQSAQLRRLMVRYSHAFVVQVATTAFANGQAKLEARLARWLLMVADRLGETFHVTHEFLALMLAVRRSGVTLGLHILEGRGLIRATRGTITVVDREGLIEHASGTYGHAEAEYTRIMEQP